MLTTFNPYKPAVIDWPKLEPEARARVVSLPIWNMAVQAEGKAKIRVATYGEEVTDPLLKKAIELDAFEEGRHKYVLSNLVEAYGIKLASEPAYLRPRDAEWAFMVTGYSECIDSFFAFGLFETAKRSGFFPSELVARFRTRDARGRPPHTVLRQLDRLASPQYAAMRKPVCAEDHRCLGVPDLGTVGSSDDVNGTAQDNNFTITGAKDVSIDIDIIDLVDICIAENERRLGIYDKRLIRPRFIPGVVRLVRSLIPRRPKKFASA